MKMEKELIRRFSDENGPLLELRCSGKRYFIRSWVPAWEPHAGECYEREVDEEEGNRILDEAEFEQELLELYNTR